MTIWKKMKKWQLYCLFVCVCVFLYIYILNRLFKRDLDEWMKEYRKPKTKRGERESLREEAAETWELVNWIEHCCRWCYCQRI